MSPELTQRLFTDFPDIFINKDKGPQESCLFFGLEVGDGWEPLIRKCCERLMRLVQLGDGPPPQASQVKEKYGSLRFYVDGASDLQDLVVDRAEFDSHHVCEQCGERGKIRRSGGSPYGWLACMCAKCAIRARSPYPITDYEAEDLGLKPGEYLAEVDHD